MTLRRKILIGYLIFIAIFVAANAWSAYRLHAMAEVSRRIIADNYDSVVATEEMKERLERQESAAAFLLLGQGETALAQIRDNRARFDAALARAQGQYYRARRAGSACGSGSRTPRVLSVGGRVHRAVKRRQCSGNADR